MRAVVQRVAASRVEIGGETVGEIGQGLMILLGVSGEDTEEEMRFLAKKIVNLRIFTDENDKMNLSLMDIGGEALVVSQFTLYADCKKGNRPSFIAAGRPEISEPLYEKLCPRTHCPGCGKGSHRTVRRGYAGLHPERRPCDHCAGYR